MQQGYSKTCISHCVKYSKCIQQINYVTINRSIITMLKLPLLWTCHHHSHPHAQEHAAACSVRLKYDSGWNV